MTILILLWDSRAVPIIEESLRIPIVHDASGQRTARHRIQEGAQVLPSAGVSPAFFAMCGDQKSGADSVWFGPSKRLPAQRAGGLYNTHYQQCMVVL
jgi:hypothetical protein